MAKYTDVHQAVHNYSFFGARWEKIKKEFETFYEHLDYLERSGVKGITIVRSENIQQFDIVAYNRTFSVQLHPQVVDTNIRGVAIFFEKLSDTQIHIIKKFMVDGGGFIADLDSTNSLPAYDGSSLQLKYWINLIDAALSMEPHPTSN